MNHQQSEFDSLARSTAKVVTEATLTSALRVQLDLMGKTGEKLIEEHRMRCAETLLTAGITLIPCDHLLDHQFAVSRGVYEAAKKIVT